MTNLLSKASLLVICCMPIAGMISTSAPAQQALFQCLDNQLLRVNGNVTNPGRRALVKHRLLPPLESRLICWQ